MLRSPARILWYVSQGVQKVVAVSRLINVEIGTPKALFRRFKKFGILEWSRSLQDVREAIQHGR